MLEEPELSFLRQHLGIYQSLDPQARRLIDDSASPRNYPDGTILRGREEECLGLILVMEGRLRVYLQGEDGRQAGLYSLGPGELCVFSASCVMAGASFELSIVAEGDVRAIRLGGQALQRLMDGSLAFANFAYRGAIERFSDLVWAVERLLFTRLDSRLAAYLLDESRGAAEGRIGSTHEEIAQRIGSAREVVSRALKSMESRGLISLGRGSVLIRDRDALRAMTRA